MIKNLKDGVLKSWLESVLPEVLSFFWSVALAFIIAYVGGKLITLVRRGVMKSMQRRNIEEGVRQFADQLLKYILWAVVIMIILGLFGFTASSFAAAVASLGVTIGLAFQGSLSNFAGGVLILILHPFRVGDYIVEDTHGNAGTVVEISVFYTKLRTIENKTIVIPNGTLANTSMTNATESDRRLLDLELSIGYDADIKKAKDILQQLAEAEERRLQNEEILVFVKELGDSAVVLGLRFWVPTEFYWDIRWNMLEQVKLSFDEAGITIPFPQLDVTLKQNETERMAE
jgi:small conductance mechanosensitive channel